MRVAERYLLPIVFAHFCGRRGVFIGQVLVRYQVQQLRVILRRAHQNRLVKRVIVFVERPRSGLYLPWSAKARLCSRSRGLVLDVLPLKPRGVASDFVHVAAGRVDLLLGRLAVKYGDVIRLISLLGSKRLRHVRLALLTARVSSCVADCQASRLRAGWRFVDARFNQDTRVLREGLGLVCQSLHMRAQLLTVGFLLQSRLPVVLILLLAFGL